MAQPSNGPRIGPGSSVAALVLALASAIGAYYEGYVPRTYADPIGIPTICFGHTGPDVTPDRTATRSECEALLQQDMAKAYADVQRCITASMTPGQAAALTSATYNAGPKLVCGSTLQRLANAGRWPEACAQLDRWVFAGGIKLPGLIKRRGSERALCESGL